MARKQNKEFSLTVSGYEYDKNLSRVPIKVFPALQALVANQHDFIEVFQKYAPEKSIFLEAHLAELAEVEETIAKEHAKYCAKREETKIKRQEKEKNRNQPCPPSAPGSFCRSYDEPVTEEEVIIDQIAATISPGLPSAKFESTNLNPAKTEKTDPRRIAIGASIKALSSLLGRGLTDQEISVIEEQVDSYLNKPE